MARGNYLSRVFLYIAPIISDVMIMKKFLCVSVLAVTILGCAAKVSDEERFAAYEQAVQELMDSYTAKAGAIMENADLSEEEKNASIEKMSDEIEKGIFDLSVKTIKEDPTSPISIDVLKNCYYYMEPEELSEIINSLSDSLKSTPFISHLEQGISAKENTAEGKMFTDFTIIQDPDNPQGSTVKFSDYVGKGKYMLVDFWASWCGPCKREIPNLKDVYARFKGDDFDILSVAVWDEPKASVDTAAAYGIPWNHIINAGEIPTDIYGIDGIPHIILFAPDGTILKRELRGEAIAQELAKYIKEK